MEDIKRRLAKILALARRGVGGEKANAESILMRELKKHGLSINDIDDENIMCERQVKWYRYRAIWERTILMQCVGHIINKSSFEYSRLRKKKQVGFNLTLVEHMELDSMYTYYSRLYKKELKTLLNAFVVKHDLFPQDQEVSSDRDVDFAELMEIRKMMAGLRESRYVSTRKQLKA